MAFKNSKFKHRNLFQAAKAAVFGIFFAFSQERNLRIDLVVFIVIGCLAKIFRFSLVEMIICFLNWVLIVSLEIVNTVLNV